MTDVNAYMSGGEGEPTAAERYERLALLGEGTFGVVSKARDTHKEPGEKNEIVAIKKIRMGSFKDGVSVTALREIKLLQEIKHPNVIDLLDVFASSTNVNMVLELCVTDLEEMIKDRSIILTPAEIKLCMQMMFEGLRACHDAWTLHRDLKPSNVLLGVDGELKLADFGLARVHGSPNGKLTHQVITRWYRPPELLYAAGRYGAGVDMWSMGCIFAELMLRMPYLPGDSDLDQLGKIYQARGTPDDDSWPGRSALGAYVDFTPCPAPEHRRLFSAASPEGLRLLNWTLELDPTKRPSVTQALAHPYFQEEPPACTRESLLAKVNNSAHVRKRVKKSEDQEASVGGDQSAKRQLDF